MLGLALSPMLPPPPQIFGGASDAGSAAFLPYNSAHASVVFRHPLTTIPVYTGYTVTPHGTPEHDAVKGMRGAEAGGTTGAVYDIQIAATGDFAAGINTAGQISFEISTAWLSVAAAAGSGSSGDALGGIQIPLVFLYKINSNTAHIYPRRASGSTGANSLIAQGATLQASSGNSFLGFNLIVENTGFIHSHGKPSSGFTRVNIGWYTDGADRLLILAIDGLTQQMLVRDDSVVPFQVLVLGGSASWFGTFVAMSNQMTGTDHWIRNLQISTLAPVVPTATTGPMENIAIMSDSIISSGSFINPYYDDAIYARIYRSLERRGLRPTTVYRMNMGGHTMVDNDISGATNASFENSSNNPLTMTVSSGSIGVSGRNIVKALNASCIIINGGSNDVGDSDVDVNEFLAACKDHIEFFLGLDGTVAGGGGTDYSGSPPGVVADIVAFTNICDRGPNWDNAATGTGVLNGTTTISSVSNPTSYADGDRIAGYSSAALYVPADSVIVSGGGTSTIVISQAAVGSGGLNLYKVVEHADSTSRVKAATFREALTTLPAWFAATHPVAAATIEIMIIDIFNGMGGTSIYDGKITNDLVHPYYAGVYRIGETIGNALAAVA